MTITENFWPEISVSRPASEPAALLKEQAEALAEKTQGTLFGTVEQSEVPPVGEAAYDLYINVNEKPYRYLFLSVQHGLHSNFPVRITRYIDPGTRQRSVQTPERSVQTPVATDFPCASYG